MITTYKLVCNTFKLQIVYDNNKKINKVITNISLHMFKTIDNQSNVH